MTECLKVVLVSLSPIILCLIFEESEKVRMVQLAARRDITLASQLPKDQLEDKAILHQRCNWLWPLSAGLAVLVHGM